MKKKVLLVKCYNPETRDIYAFKQIPIGIAYLAAAVKDFCDLEVFNMLVDDGLLEKIRREKPDVIGLSIFSVDFIFAEKLIKMIKKVSPESLIVAGGAHSTAEPIDTLRAGADVVVRGEGEFVFQKIIQLLSADSLIREEVRGISYFDANHIGGICHNQIVCIDDIDDFSMPAIDVFDMRKYDQYPLLTSRGCPFGCKFCASKTIWGQKVRFHSAERVFQEIKRAVENYGFNHLVFIDDTFTLKHTRLFDICDRIINADYGVTWSVNSRVDTINDEVAEKMSAAGCKVVSFGIETGSELIQEAVDKKLNRRQMKEAFNACRKAGIRIKTGWMVGLPGDYGEQMRSLDLMLELEPDEISIHHFIPMPGTYYWHQPEKHGIYFDKRILLSGFSIDALPDKIGLKFSYITNEEIAAVIQEMIRVLEQAGYKRPGQLSSYDLKSKVVNTYLDRGRLPVLPSKKSDKEAT
ncbi:hypothetical protein COT99_00405 [Candidatus Falkowbacteria bacterium CG10_big_fil_rev_8_21_14_0_10_43_10]|uniref:Uncharacterized protein n=1 Tax=Candidatus Falkowbacteria bacterium CG10_big_fil_rev_8_21_14_0_10_43_10 TaxID=1974567 RepID=A0A2H0V367_9BACT|nr:MAG: hypothetical protein COT99_00405 [Candidatus Falkowbacteria bacterium CG10_big_fil_rev_8_21_14_0_10_43_10]